MRASMIRHATTKVPTHEEERAATGGDGITHEGEPGRHWESTGQTQRQGSKTAGGTADCDNCPQSQAFESGPGPGQACCCKRCNGIESEVCRGRGSQSRKRARDEELSNAGPSTRGPWSQLFISESGGAREVRVVAETAEVGVQAREPDRRGMREMGRPFGPTNAPSKTQVDDQEWMGHQVEWPGPGPWTIRDRRKVLASALLG